MLSELDRLWDRGVENEFLKEVKQFGYQHSSDRFRSHQLYDSNLPCELSFTPARFLPVVCALDKDGRIRPTPVGRIIKNLDKLFKDRGQEAFFVLTSGAAKEACLRAKPFCKTRANKEGFWEMEKYDIGKNKPVMDGDILLISSEIREKDIKEVLDLLPEESLLKIRFRQSGSRAISMIKIVGVIPREAFCWQERERRYSVAQMFAPEFKAINSFDNPLISHVISHDTNSRMVMIIPVETEEGFVGAEMDFFYKFRNANVRFEQKGRGGRTQKRSLRIAFFLNFEEAFPFRYSPSEAFVHYCHFLRDVTWDNHLRLILGSSSLCTSLTIAQKIVYPVAREPSLIVKDTQSMLHHTNRLLEGMKKLLDGDPFLGLIYMLSAGENPARVPVYGTGLIDQKGFFPELYNFLHKDGRINKLVSIMETCDYGVAELGWSTFISFVYEETGKDLRKVDSLLCPIFCSNDVFPTLVDNYVRKALSKFYPMPLRDPCTGTFLKH